jgi:hypothetical protein
MSLDVNKNFAMPRENDEQLKSVMKYHILVQLRTMIYFANYKYRGSLYLCILETQRYWNKNKHQRLKDIGTKTNI